MLAACSQVYRSVVDAIWGRSTLSSMTHIDSRHPAVRDIDGVDSAPLLRGAEREGDAVVSVDSTSSFRKFPVRRIRSQMRSANASARVCSEAWWVQPLCGVSEQFLHSNPVKWFLFFWIVGMIVIGTGTGYTTMNLGVSRGTSDAGKNVTLPAYRPLPKLGMMGGYGASIPFSGLPFFGDATAAVVTNNVTWGSALSTLTNERALTHPPVLTSAYPGTLAVASRDMPISLPLADPTEFGDMVFPQWQNTSVSREALYGSADPDLFPVCGNVSSSAGVVNEDNDFAKAYRAVPQLFVSSSVSVNVVFSAATCATVIWAASLKPESWTPFNLLLVLLSLAIGSVGAVNYKPLIEESVTNIEQNNPSMETRAWVDTLIAQADLSIIAMMVLNAATTYSTGISTLLMGLIGVCAKGFHRQIQETSSRMRANLLYGALDLLTFLGSSFLGLYAYWFVIAQYLVKKDVFSLLRLHCALAMTHSTRTANVVPVLLGMLATPGDGCFGLYFAILGFSSAINGFRDFATRMGDRHASISGRALSAVNLLTLFAAVVFVAASTALPSMRQGGGGAAQQIPVALTPMVFNLRAIVLMLNAICNLLLGRFWSALADIIGSEDKLNHYTTYPSERRHFDSNVSFNRHHIGLMQDALMQLRGNLSVFPAKETVGAEELIQEMLQEIEKVLNAKADIAGAYKRWQAYLVGEDLHSASNRLTELWLAIVNKRTQGDFAEWLRILGFTDRGEPLTMSHKPGFNTEHPWEGLRHIGWFIMCRRVRRSVCGTPYRGVMGFTPYILPEHPVTYFPTTDATLQNSLQIMHVLLQKNGVQPLGRASFQAAHLHLVKRVFKELQRKLSTESSADLDEDLMPLIENVLSAEVDADRWFLRQEKVLTDILRVLLSAGPGSVGSWFLKCLIAIGYDVDVVGDKLTVTISKGVNPADRWYQRAARCGRKVPGYFDLSERLTHTDNTSDLDILTAMEEALDELIPSVASAGAGAAGAFAFSGASASAVATAAVVPAT